MLTYFFDINLPYAMLFSLVLCFGGSLLIGPRLIATLRARKAGQPRREASKGVLAPEHQDNVGTPTMGGVMIIGLILLSALLFGDLSSPRMHACLLVLIVTAGLGFMDDYAKITKASTDGVSPRVKLLLQGGAALVACIYFYFMDSSFAGQLTIPCYGFVDIGWGIIPLGFFVIMGTSNAVNLTDGLDGLAGGCMAIVAFFFAIISWTVGESSCPLLMVAVLGACLGFLWFNCYPAKVFMGDTGSLALGGLLGTVAVCSGNALILAIAGLVFVCEALSVMIQVAWFKYTKKKYGEGRRFFRMAPFHHHLEQCGWRETQISVRLWIVTFLLCILALWGAYSALLQHINTLFSCV